MMRQKSISQFCKGIALASAFVLLAPMGQAQETRPSLDGLLRRLEKQKQGLPPKEQQAWEALRRMVLAERGVAYSGREVRLEAGRDEVENQVRSDPRWGMRLDGIRPPAGMVLDNGKSTYLYSPKSRRWTQRDSFVARMKGRIADVFRRLMKGEIRATVEGEDKVAGHVADIVRVGPAAGMPGPSRRFWIDRATGLRLRTEQISAEGRVQNSSYFTSIDLSPALKAEDFALPDGATPVRAFPENRQQFATIEEAEKAGFAVRGPGYVPTGYTLQRVDVMGKEAAKARVTLRYSNRIAVISIARTPLEAIPSRLRDRVQTAGFLPSRRGGSERAYAWGDNKYGYILFSSLSEEEVKRIANSF